MTAKDMIHEDVYAFTYNTDTTQSQYQSGGISYTVMRQTVQPYKRNQKC